MQWSDMWVPVCVHVCEGVSVYVLQSVNQAVLLLIGAAAVQRSPPLLPDLTLQQAGHSGEEMSLQAALANDSECIFSALSPGSPEGLSLRCPQW